MGKSDPFFLVLFENSTSSSSSSTEPVQCAEFSHSIGFFIRDCYRKWLSQTRRTRSWVRSEKSSWLPRRRAARRRRCGNWQICG